MKHFTLKNVVHKTIITTVSAVVLMTAMMPSRVSAADFSDVPGSILKEIVQLADLLGDVVMGVLNKYMVGADGLGSAMLELDDKNVQEGSGSWIMLNVKDKPVETLELESSYKIPNMLYSPDSIFGNKIAVLDVNFLRQNKYKDSVGNNAESAASQLGETIASWYKAFRNIAVVGLLSVLVYLGIRILISSAATDKAKYKENLKDWVVALCLVFVIHILMSGILMFTDKVTELFADSSNSIYTVTANGKTFNTNLVGLIRLKAEGQAWQDATAYAVIYLVLVIYTIVFTIMYLKRFLWIAFLTMIAPLVALTYPLDKAGDSKAQAFAFWLKEYTMHVIIQPVHLILYMVLVTSANELVIKNPVYALVAIGFLIPAEKFIKQMFGLDKANTTSDFGSVAKNLLALQGLNSLRKAMPGKKSIKSGGGGSDASADIDEGANNDKINFNKMDRPTLGSFDKNTDNINAQNGGLGNDESEEKQRLEQELNDYENDPNNDAYNDAVDPNSEYSQKLARFQELEAKEKQSESEQDNQLNAGQGTPENQVRAGYKKRVIKRAAKATGKKFVNGFGKSLRVAAKFAGAGVGATLGMAGGIATGDFGNVIQSTAAGFGAGLGIGDSLGKAAVKLPGNIQSSAKGIYNGARNLGNTMTDALNEEKYGAVYAKQVSDIRENERARKEFLKSDKEKEKCRRVAAEIGYDGDLSDLMGAVADYKEAGVSDDMIKNALKVEKKRDGTIGGDNHQKMIDVASFATQGGYTQADIRNAKSRESLEDTIESVVGQKDRYEVGKSIAELFGDTSRKTYEKNSRFRPR